MSNIFRRIAHVPEKIEISGEGLIVSLAWKLLKQTGSLVLTNPLTRPGVLQMSQDNWNGLLEWTDRHALYIIAHNDPTNQDNRHLVQTYALAMEKLIKLRIIPVVQRDDRMFLDTENYLRVDQGLPPALVIKPSKEHIKKMTRLING